MICVLFNDARHSANITTLRISTVIYLQAPHNCKLVEASLYLLNMGIVQERRRVAETLSRDVSAIGKRHTPIS